MKTAAAAAAAVQSNGGGNSTRRRASSNYIALEGGKKQKSADLDEVFERLARQFGFQRSSVLNQREHVAMLFTSHLSHQSEANEAKTWAHFHRITFRNYERWCEFINLNPVESTTTGSQIEQLALYFLIWGEAANIRFLPECLCFLFHKMASKLQPKATIAKSSQDGKFMQCIIQPIYNVLAMEVTKHKKLDHEDVANYDDINEFFWDAKNVNQCTEFNVASVMASATLKKTFQEKRSFATVLLCFFRIYMALALSFHVLILIAYIAHKGAPSNRNGFSFYSNFFNEQSKVPREHAFYSLFMSISGCLFVKSILQLWLEGRLLFLHYSFIHIGGLFTRICWHILFCGVFITIMVSPMEPAFGNTSNTYLDMAPLVVVIYCLPVFFASLLKLAATGGGVSRVNKKEHSFLKKWRIFFLGGRREYTGQEVSQSWSDFITYSIFWSVVAVGKLTFNLQLMVKPLIGPSVEIWDLLVPASEGVIESKHNVAYLCAIWIPVFLVFIYDTQIWFAIMQSVVGMYLGFRMKIGSFSRMRSFLKDMKKAPCLFDQKIVSKLARSTVAEDRDEGSLLRFAVVWNECIGSFRLGDLISDREREILQYHVGAQDGQVWEPVFVLAQSARPLIDLLATKVRKDKKMTAQTLMKFDENSKWVGNHLLGLTLEFLTWFYPADKEDQLSIFFEKLSAFLQEQETMNTPLASLANWEAFEPLTESLINLLTLILDTEIDPETSLEDQMCLISEAHMEAMMTCSLDFCECLQAFLGSSSSHLKEILEEALVHCCFHQRDSSYSYKKKTIIFLLSERVDLKSMMRLFLLLTLDVADGLPACKEARRRLGFFLNSLQMNIPSIDEMDAMSSLSVITPYYNETVLYSLEELCSSVISETIFTAIEQDTKRHLTILKYLMTCYPDEWKHFLERVGCSTMEESLVLEEGMAVRLWASARGQTLGRTVQGIMMYEDAIKMLRWLEIGGRPTLSHQDKLSLMSDSVVSKFNYITSCQLYAQQAGSNDSRAQDIDFLLRKYPNWRVAFVEEKYVNGEVVFECVLIKSEAIEVSNATQQEEHLISAANSEIVEVYRYELPGRPILGEGKPENQNIAMAFSRGEYIQTIDMNQEHYFEECLKMPHFLQTAQKYQQQHDHPLALIGMKEHIFTGSASSLARFMTLQELVFVSLTQRVLANPLRTRMHYGHPDVFEKSFMMAQGGVSKASKGINLSEDVFAGYNLTLRGGSVSHQEFIQCGKGRDVALSQINAFEAKLAQGSAESSISRESYRLGLNLDFVRLHSMYYGHMGFYISTALTMLCVYVYAYAKLYTALSPELALAAISKTSSLDDLAQVLNTQFLFQFGMLLTIPLAATLVTEFGSLKALVLMLEVILTLGPIFYVFESGTKAHFYDVALLRGNSKYTGTGRGFRITRERFVGFFRLYAASHFRKAMELAAVMVLFGVYGKFNIGKDAKVQFCQARINVVEGALPNCKDLATDPIDIINLDSYGKTGQSYGVASFAVWFLIGCFMSAPFLFNTDGLNWLRTRTDLTDWLAWMFSFTKRPSTADSKDQSLLSSSQSDDVSNSWLSWWLAQEADWRFDLSLSARLAYLIRECRHVAVSYFIFRQAFDGKSIKFQNSDLISLVLFVVGFCLFLTLIGCCFRVTKQKIPLFVGCLIYLILSIGFLAGVGLFVNQDKPDIDVWSVLIAVCAGCYGLYECGLVLCLWGTSQRAEGGIPKLCLYFLREVAFFFDLLVGVLVAIPLILLSIVPFMGTLQTRLMYNKGFAQDLSQGTGEFAFAGTISLVVAGGLGFSHGFLSCACQSLGYLNQPFKWHLVNTSFNYFLDQLKYLSFNKNDILEQLAGKLCIGYAIGVILIVGFLFCFGRKVGMIVSIIVSAVGVAAIYLATNEISDVNLLLLQYVGLGGVSCGIGMGTLSTVLYTHEISVPSWKSKSVLLYILGTLVGWTVEASLLYKMNEETLAKEWNNRPLHNWRNHFLYGIIPSLILLPVLFWLPESPIWLYVRRGPEACEKVLIRLRQRHDVYDELYHISQHFPATPKKNDRRKSNRTSHLKSQHSVRHDQTFNGQYELDRKSSSAATAALPHFYLTHLSYKEIWPRIFFLIGLTLLSSLSGMSNVLIFREVVKYRSNAENFNNEKVVAGTYWPVYLALFNLVGTCICLFVIEAIRRKTLLKDILPVVAILALTGAVLNLNIASSDIIGVIVQATLIGIYFLLGLSVQSLTWLCALEMFPSQWHVSSLGLTLSAFYLCSMGLHWSQITLSSGLFITSGISFVLSIAVFCFFASNSQGGIRLKSEKRKEKQLLKEIQNELDLDSDEQNFDQLRESRVSRSFTRLRALSSSRNSHRALSDRDLNNNSFIRQSSHSPRDSMYLQMATPTPSYHNEKDKQV